VTPSDRDHPLPTGKVRRRRRSTAERTRPTTTPDDGAHPEQAAPELADPVLPRPAPTGRWGPDVLGPDYQAQTFPQPDDDEGAVVTTVVRYRPRGTRMPRRVPWVVLHVHGWADYFLHTELAEFWHARGAAFYAVDLRRSGRSIRAHQTPAFVESLREYDADLDTAVGVIRAAHGDDVRILVWAHSQGGLTTPLWAARRPGTVSGFVLNAPFLDIHGSSLARTMGHPVVSGLARNRSRWPIPIPSPGFYDRTIDGSREGEWHLEPAWRPSRTHPMRPGWLKAVLDGQATLSRGLGLDVPILVLTSSSTAIGSRWREEMRRADAVIDVKQVWRRAPDLGPTVTLARVEDALHDVVLSPHPVRDRAYDEVARWARGYLGLDAPDR
jgi:alpha-beta hydrolase superfamily lysophospholipase